jgi:hypothetical protein
MMEATASTDPVDAGALLDALWKWETCYRAAYSQMNVAEVRRIWFVLTQLAELCAKDYQKATHQLPDTDDQYVVHPRG